MIRSCPYTDLEKTLAAQGVEARKSIDERLALVPDPLEFIEPPRFIHWRDVRRPARRGVPVERTKSFSTLMGSSPFAISVLSIISGYLAGPCAASFSSATATRLTRPTAASLVPSTLPSRTSGFSRPRHWRASAPSADLPPSMRARFSARA